MLSELCRVTRCGGKIIIPTLNWFPRFYRHPENARPYPPEVFWRYFSKQYGVSSPMYPGMPNCKIISLSFRRPPLFRLYSTVSKRKEFIFSVINTIQYKLYLRRYWRYDSYVIVLEKIN
jgi:hypothetical protein